MIVDDVRVVSPDKCDILFFSCFGIENLKYDHCRKIFYNSESYSNDYFLANYYLSHDYDSSVNSRFPHWMMVIDWFGVGTYTNPTWLTPPEWFSQESRVIDDSMLLRKFMAAVYTNTVQNRAEAAYLLSRRFCSVDVYGRPHQLKLEDTNLAKHNTISQYKFSMAFENVIRYGYVTEKLFHARVANTVPIYWGTKDVAMDFNPDGFIHFNGDYEGQLFPAIEGLLANPKRYLEMIRQPIFQKTPTIDDALSIIERAL
jgi:hypothetical protein